MTLKEIELRQKTVIGAVQELAVLVQDKSLDTASLHRFVTEALELAETTQDTAVEATVAAHELSVQTRKDGRYHMWICLANTITCIATIAYVVFR